MKYVAILKSIGAIIAGFVAVAALSMLTDFVLESAGMFPPASEPHKYTTGMLFFALIYRSIYVVAGGYLTAMLAPTNKMRHVIVLGVLGLIGGTVGVFVGWNLSAHWYPIALAVTAFPLVYLGGWLRNRRAN